MARAKLSIYLPFPRVIYSVILSWIFLERSFAPELSWSAVVEVLEGFMSPRLAGHSYFL